MSGTGFTFPWESAAIHGDPMPAGLSLADQMAYTSLRQIYHSYRAKTISREQAAREKILVRRSYDKAVDDQAFADKLTRHHVRVLKDSEAAKAACRKDPTPENARQLCDVLDGLERYRQEDAFSS